MHTDTIIIVKNLRGTSSSNVRHIHRLCTSVIEFLRLSNDILFCVSIKHQNSPAYGCGTVYPRAHFGELYNGTPPYRQIGDRSL